MATKVFNKLLSICTNLDGGTTSSDSKSSTTRTTTISTTAYTDECSMTLTEDTEYFTATIKITDTIPKIV